MKLNQFHTLYYIKFNGLSTAKDGLSVDILCDACRLTDQIFRLIEVGSKSHVAIRARESRIDIHSDQLAITQGKSCLFRAQFIYIMLMYFGYEVIGVVFIQFTCLMYMVQMP